MNPASQDMIGWNSKVMFMKPFLMICPRLVARRLNSGWCATVTMPATSSLDALALASWSLSIWPWSIRSPDNKPQLKPLSLVPNLLQWNTALKGWGYCDISFAWWVSLYQGALTFMLTISHKWPIPLSLLWFYRRNAIRSVITQFVNLLPWVNLPSLILNLAPTLLTSCPRSWPGLSADS